ncbi:hypothetical protein, partial [Segatella hominis]|uniref:hypothetical protein n=1 Tax=Segatella hominis TaxID=2518605 RepID=UPI003AB1C8BA
TIVFILPLHLDYTKVIILILWWRNFQLEYWRTFQLVSTPKALSNTRSTMTFPIYGSHSSAVASSQTTMILSYDGPKPSSVTIQSTSVSSNPATTWTPDEYGSFNFSGNKCDNIKATGMIKYGSIYKHKYEMVGWCSKNSSGIVDDGKITGFHAI